MMKHLHLLSRRRSSSLHVCLCLSVAFAVVGCQSMYFLTDPDKGKPVPAGLRALCWLGRCLRVETSDRSQGDKKHGQIAEK